MPVKLYIGQIPKEATREDVMSLFEKFGPVDSIEMKTGYGFLTYRDDVSNQEAISALHRSNYMGSNLVVQPAKRDLPSVTGADATLPPYRKDNVSTPGGSNCYKCGTPGHFARECNNPPLEGRAKMSRRSYQDDIPFGDTRQKSRLDAPDLREALSKGRHDDRIDQCWADRRQNAPPPPPPLAAAHSREPVNYHSARDSPSAMSTFSKRREPDNVAESYRPSPGVRPNDHRTSRYDYHYDYQSLSPRADGSRDGGYMYDRPYMSREMNDAGYATTYRDFRRENPDEYMDHRRTRLEGPPLYRDRMEEPVVERSRRYPERDDMISSDPYRPRDPYAVSSRREERMMRSPSPRRHHVEARSVDRYAPTSMGHPARYAREPDAYERHLMTRGRSRSPLRYESDDRIGERLAFRMERVPPELTRDRQRRPISRSPPPLGARAAEVYPPPVNRQPLPERERYDARGCQDRVDCLYPETRESAIRGNREEPHRDDRRDTWKATSNVNMAPEKKGLVSAVEGGWGAPRQTDRLDRFSGDRTHVSAKITNDGRDHGVKSRDGWGNSLPGARLSTRSGDNWENPAKTASSKSRDGWDKHSSSEPEKPLRESRDTYNTSVSVRPGPPMKSAGAREKPSNIDRTWEKPPVNKKPYSDRDKIGNWKRSEISENQSAKNSFSENTVSISSWDDWQKSEPANQIPQQAKEVVPWEAKCSWDDDHSTENRSSPKDGSAPPPPHSERPSRPHGQQRPFVKNYANSGPVTRSTQRQNDNSMDVDKEKTVLVTGHRPHTPPL